MVCVVFLSESESVGGVGVVYICISVGNPVIRAQMSLGHSSNYWGKTWKNQEQISPYV